MGLDQILAFTVVVDMESGVCDINYPTDVGYSDFEMIKLLRQIVSECYMELRNDLIERGKDNEYDGGY